MRTSVCRWNSHCWMHCMQRAGSSCQQGPLCCSPFEPQACICPACPTFPPFSHHRVACPELSSLSICTAGASGDATSALTLLYGMEFVAGRRRGLWQLQLTKLCTATQGRSTNHFCKPCQACGRLEAQMWATSIGHVMGQSSGRTTFHGNTQAQQCHYGMQVVCFASNTRLIARRQLCVYLSNMMR